MKYCHNYETVTFSSKIVLRDLWKKIVFDYSDRGH